jgi:hypothetical protein
MGVLDTDDDGDTYDNLKELDGVFMHKKCKL